MKRNYTPKHSPPTTNNKSKRNHKIMSPGRTLPFRSNALLQVLLDFHLSTTLVAPQLANADVRGCLVVLYHYGTGCSIPKSGTDIFACAHVYFFPVRFAVLRLRSHNAVVPVQIPEDSLHVGRNVHEHNRQVVRP